MPCTCENLVAEGSLRVASQQWASIGAALHAGPRAHLVVDPECLLWFTLEIARRDPRLFDEVLDWLEGNGGRIALPRLKATGPDKEDLRWRLLAAIGRKASLSTEAGTWGRALESWASSCAHDEPKQPVFLDLTGRALPLLAEADTDFGQFGFSRGKYQSRRQAGRPDLTRPASLLLRAKGLFGATAGAYVWAALLTSEGGSQSILAERVGYGKQTVANVLGGFVEAGICREERRGAGTKWYALTDRRGWRSLLGWTADELRWPHWARLFRGLVHLCRRWTWCNQQGLTEYLFASELRKAFVEVKEDIVACGLDVTAPTPDLFLVDELFERLEAYLRELFDRALGIR